MEKKIIQIHGCIKVTLIVLPHQLDYNYSIKQQLKLANEINNLEHSVTKA